MAIATFYQKADTVDYTPTAAISAGDVVVIGDRLGIAAYPIAAGALGAVKTEGVFTANKDGNAIGATAVVYWDVSAKVFTATATDNVRAGVAAAAALAGDATFKLILNL